MNILFLVHRYPNNNESILEKDLIKVFSEKKNNVLVVVPIEWSKNSKTKVYRDGNIVVLQVRIFNYATTELKIEKIISILTRSFFINRAIKKYFKNEKIDYIVGYTPFMADSYLISNLKNYYKAKTLLSLWDIFPQNAKDLNFIKNSIIFKYAKYKEKKMYEYFDKIMCNCEGQVQYILDNKLKDLNNIFISRNSEYQTEENYNKLEIRKKFSFKPDDIVAIFGGNMGIPQELENIIFMAENLQDKKIKFILLGNGTEKNRLKKIVKDRNITNIKIKDYVPRNEYEDLIRAANIGIISLNHNYTVPNFPAKVTGYCKVGIPIFASLDNCSYNFLGKFIEENNLGIVTNAGDTSKMKKDFLRLVENLHMYEKNKIQNVYKNEFDIKNAYEIIMCNIEH